MGGGLPLAIKLIESENTPAQSWDKLHLLKFILDQPMEGNAKKFLIIKCVLSGTDSEGKQVFNENTVWRKDYSDIEGYILKAYCEQNQIPIEQGYAEYKSHLANADNKGLLECMAYFQRSIALLYELDKGKTTQVE